MKSTHTTSHTIHKDDNCAYPAKHYQKINPMILPKNPHKQIELTNRMRLVWSQHIYWTRMLLISIIDKSKDQDEVTQRILQNPKDISNIYSNYYLNDITNNITQLLTEHLEIGASLITALRDGKSEEANQWNRRWYINADKIAYMFSRINPYYRKWDLRKMLYKHLELITQETVMHLAGKYETDIEIFNKMEQQALMMADYFTSGIMRHFPQKFD